MSRKTISAETVFARWREDPAYVAAYDALEDEFALAGALIKARNDAGLTQAQVAEAMNTTQAAIARLDGPERRGRRGGGRALALGDVASVETAGAGRGEERAGERGDGGLRDSCAAGRCHGSHLVMGR